MFSCSCFYHEHVLLSSLALSSTHRGPRCPNLLGWLRHQPGSNTISFFPVLTRTLLTATSNSPAFRCVSFFLTFLLLPVPAFHWAPFQSPYYFYSLPRAFSWLLRLSTQFRFFDREAVDSAEEISCWVQIEPVNRFCGVSESTEGNEIIAKHVSILFTS